MRVQGVGANEKICKASQIIMVWGELVKLLTLQALQKYRMFLSVRVRVSQVQAMFSITSAFDTHCAGWVTHIKRRVIDLGLLSNTFH